MLEGGDVKVVLLCGGYGTRIRDVADDIPKAMIPIGGYPILWHIMKSYAHWGYKEFVLCLGYKGQVIKDFFLTYEAHTRDFTIKLGSSREVIYHSNHDESEWKVTLADTGLSAMTGARIQSVQKYVAGEKNFMLSYGDGVSNVNMDSLMKFHQSHGKILTITGVRPPGRFGELASDPTGLVTEFNEKPQASGGRISGGFFVCRQELFDYLDVRDNLVLEMEPMKKLQGDKQMMVYEHNGFWQPMDTFRDYTYLNSLCNKNEAPWIKW